jgi:hypothetical protein
LESDFGLGEEAKIIPEGGVAAGFAGGGWHSSQELRAELWFENFECFSREIA